MGAGTATAITQAIAGLGDGRTSLAVQYVYRRQAAPQVKAMQGGVVHRAARSATRPHGPVVDGPRCAKDVVGITGVQQAQAVTGPYDVIVRAEAHNIDELGQLVVARVQAVDGITRTLTCPVVYL